MISLLDWMIQHFFTFRGKYSSSVHKLTQWKQNVKLNEQIQEMLYQLSKINRNQTTKLLNYFYNDSSAWLLWKSSKEGERLVLTVAKSAYYTRLWASFFVKLREKILGRGLWFFGLFEKKYACYGNLTSNFVSLFMFAVFSNALIDTISACSQ